MGPVSATELFDPPSDDPVPVDRLMVASAYWDGRDDAPTKDAEGALSLLTRLAAIDPSMSEWMMVVGKQGEPVPLAGDAAGLAEQMAERTRAAEIAPGVSAMLVSDSVAMRVRIGIPSGTDTRFGTNGIALWQGSPDVPGFWLTESSSLLDALVKTFDPETAVVGSRRHSEAQPRAATINRNWIQPELDRCGHLCEGDAQVGSCPDVEARRRVGDRPD